MLEPANSNQNDSDQKEFEEYIGGVGLVHHEVQKKIKSRTESISSPNRKRPRYEIKNQQSPLKTSESAARRLQKDEDPEESKSRDVFATNTSQESCYETCQEELNAPEDVVLDSQESESPQQRGIAYEDRSDSGSAEIGEEFSDFGEIMDQKSIVKKTPEPTKDKQLNLNNSTNSDDMDAEMMKEMQSERFEDHRDPSSHRSLSPDVFSPASPSPQKLEIPEESVKIEEEEDMKMEVDEDDGDADGPASNLAELTQLGSSDGSFKIDEEDDPPMSSLVSEFPKTEKRAEGAPVDVKMEEKKKAFGIITDEQCTTDFRYLLEEQFNKRKLEFLPDFEAKNFNKSKDYRYCEIPGLPTPDRPYRDNHYLLNQIQWRPFHPYMPSLDRNPYSYRQKPEEIANRMYLTDKNTLEQWLREHRYSAEGHSGGFQMFSHVLHQLGRIGGYNSFLGLLKYFNTVAREHNSEKYVLDQFANVVRIALSAEEILPKRIYRLTDFVESATFSHVQCAALLARMFFKPKTSHSLSFHYLLEHDDELSIEKLRFLFAYFDRIATNPPKGCVSFRLKTVRNDEFKEEWIKNKCNPMPDVRIYDQMVIEETALCTQIDFANEYLGGGVLKSGAVQEEIRFLMCPEMIVGMLLTDKMDDTQAISIVGAYVYSGYTGYANKLKWRPLSGRYARQNDARLRDKYGRLRVETVAIDAMYFKTKAIAEQVTSDSLTREMKKAYTGFSTQSEHFGQIPIVTGFWGCGAFNGHKPLKFLQQVIIAGMVKRPLVFCTFQEGQTMKHFKGVMARLRSENVSIGQLNSVLRKIATSQIRLPYIPTETFVFDFVFQYLAGPQNRALLDNLKPLKSTS
ncbi:hypothetical protein L3Y34_005366 [Caenorhabditis briggsae]|uniref:poly(ADP-ribose) glycohydrolase n=2 Tax=Caenorhabditis briggsae TaxID=6238 RepID=A0AAE9D612_CAEBR|nr:hypothetical protein L3Y34_005366 [Caenorhabditis briggsae]